MLLYQIFYNGDGILYVVEYAEASIPYFGVILAVNFNPVYDARCQNYTNVKLSEQINSKSSSVAQGLTTLASKIKACQVGSYVEVYDVGVMIGYLMNELDDRGNVSTCKTSS